MNSLNRPIDPAIISKCIAVPLLLIAGYLIWLGAVDVLNLIAVASYDILFLIAFACVLVVIAFCILFAAQAFRGRRINAMAMVMAILQIAGFVLAFAFATIWFGGATNGPAILLGFAAFFYIFLLPASITAAVLATAGIIALLKSKQIV